MRSRRIQIREPFCGVSHLIGVILSVAALIVLLVESRGRPLYLVSFAIYGASLIALYSVSTLYHSLPVDEGRIEWWKRLDHMAIFLLIAGTYTPVCLVTLHGALGWKLLGIVYGIAALGITMLLLWKKMPSWLRVTFYIAMGWVAVFAMPSLRNVLPAAAIGWLIVGGLTYTLGTIVYATDRPHLWPGKFSAHDLWHIFVMGGSICHFLLMLFIVMPQGKG